MWKLLPKKRTKGKSTDLPIVKLILDVYVKDNPLYEMRYNTYKRMWESMKTTIPSEEKLKEIQDWPTEYKIKYFYTQLNLWDELLENMHFTWKSIFQSQKFINTSIKAVDVTKKYWISNVTIKKRLIGTYFDRDEIKEWNKKYLALKPKEWIIWQLAFYFFMQEDDHPMSHWIRNLIALLDENLPLIDKESKKTS